MIGDPYRSPTPSEAEDVGPAEEPVVTGTLFFMALLLIVIFSVWVVMYIKLLER